jgi:hypothetical protein
MLKYINNGKATLEGPEKGGMLTTVNNLVELLNSELRTLITKKKQSSANTSNNAKPSTESVYADPTFASSSNNGEDTHVDPRTLRQSSNKELYGEEDMPGNLNQNTVVDNGRTNNKSASADISLYTTPAGVSEASEQNDTYADVEFIGNSSQLTPQQIAERDLRLEQQKKNDGVIYSETVREVNTNA